MRELHEGDISGRARGLHKVDRDREVRACCTGEREGMCAWTTQERRVELCA